MQSLNPGSPRDPQEVPFSALAWHFCTPEALLSATLQAVWDLDVAKGGVVSP